MQSIVSRLVRLFLLLAAGVCSWPAQGAYVFTSIDENPDFTEVFGINESGQVVGIGSTQFSYDPKSGSFTAIPPPTGPLFSSVFGINDSGAMVGVVSFDGLTEVGYARDKHGAYALFSMPGWDNVESRGISSTGLIAGYAFDNAFTTTVGFIYDPARNTFVTFLPSPYTLAQGINSRGDVVGHVTLDADVACTGCLAGRYGFWRSARGAITYFQVNGMNTEARGITDSGLITGIVESGLTAQGFVISLGGAPYESITVPAADLLEIPGAIITVPEGMSNAGDIVGNWEDVEGNLHGFIATPSKKK